MDTIAIVLLEIGSPIQKSSPEIAEEVKGGVCNNQDKLITWMDILTHIVIGIWCFSKMSELDKEPLS